MPRLNQDLPAEIHRAAKAAAAEQGVSLKQYVADAIAQANARHAAGKADR